METVVQAAVAALLGLISGLIGGYFSGRQQSRQEREKEARLAVAELAKNLGAASHSMAWLTWKALHRSTRFEFGDLDTYDQEIHALLPSISGSLAVVSALSGSLYTRLDPFVQQVYKLDVDIAKAGTCYLETPAEGLKLLGELHALVAAFSSELNRRVANIFEEQRSHGRVDVPHGKLPN